MENLYWIQGILITANISLILKLTFHVSLGRGTSMIYSFGGAVMKRGLDFGLLERYFTTAGPTKLADNIPLRYIKLRLF
jgi:hypothetical protein